MSWLGRMRLWKLNRKLRKEGKMQIPFDGILWEVQLWNRLPQDEPEWVFRADKRDS